MISIKNKKRRLQLVFVLICLLFLTEVVSSQNQGPSSPEAGGFEPVDATDMVNLSTGDLTYVLPLLNVPSPEGGFPIALAYHAGISMDQESTWTGLGWNLNTGAINRSVNGYPDDYNGTVLNEYFYDRGWEDSVYTLAAGFSSINGYSVGLGVSWGSNRSLGGFVSVGYGLKGLGGSLTVDSQGSYGAGIGYNTGSLSFGVSANSSGNISGSLGHSTNSNSIGFSLSSNGSLGVNLASTNNSEGNQNSIGMSLSSKGVSLHAGNKTGNNTIQGIGVGISMQFESTVHMGNYSLSSSGWQIPIYVPTKIGVFSLTFGKQKLKYYYDENENKYMYGPIYYSDNPGNEEVWAVDCFLKHPGDDFLEGGGTLTTQSLTEANQFIAEAEADGCECTIVQLSQDSGVLDIYEIPLDNNSFGVNTNAEMNNPVFPNYDVFNVQAQGLSGSMKAKRFENGALFGVSGRENVNNYKLEYAIGGESSNIPLHAQFNQKAEFYFDNEISTYFGVTDVSEAQFFDVDKPIITSYYKSGEAEVKPRRKNGNFIEYFSNEEIIKNYNSVKSRGFLKPIVTGFDRNKASSDGIGAFKITSPDGKTYHYSLPVLNHEIITRTFGVSEKNRDEEKSYLEKRQLEPYATHWLLTSITGSDFYDQNENGIADEGDYGYWVNFDYGKWSDAFIWKAPYGRDHIVSSFDDNVKTWIRGRKDMYYLDKIQTRTHTAIFIKSERKDGKSDLWNYYSVNHRDDIEEQDETDFKLRFSIPSQFPLKLDKIILLKNEKSLISKSSGGVNIDQVDLNFPGSDKTLESAYFNLNGNIIDSQDNWSELYEDAIKVIDFEYSNKLVKGSPNTYIDNSDFGRLTLDNIYFKGKGAVEVLPPYSFSYNNDESYIFNIEDKDAFGYYSKDNSMWSLNKIATPNGGEILIDYESHKFKTVVDSKITFRKYDLDFNMSLDMDGGNMRNGDQPRAFIIDSKYDLGIQIGDEVYISYAYTGKKTISGNPDERVELLASYEGIGTVSSSLGDNKFLVSSNSNIWEFDYDEYTNSSNPSVWNCDYYEVEYSASFNVESPIEAGGIRASKLTTTDGIDSYESNYFYGTNSDGIGYISYLPYAPELQEELPYSAELPAPRVMYEYVSLKQGNESSSKEKIKYKFKVLKSKDLTKIKFDDLYEISVESENFTNQSQNKEVNISHYTIKDNLSSIGTLLEVSTFNSKGHLLSRIKNEYYLPEETPNNFGITKESYQSYKTVDFINNTSSLKDKWLINSSTRIKYPSLLKSSVELKQGVKYSTNYQNLDPITGTARDIDHESSDGTKYRLTSIPAYEKYGKMGSKVDNISNRNMLTQQTAKYTYLLNDTNEIDKVIGAGITTWSNDWTYRNFSGVKSSPISENEKIWRKHKDFVWNGGLDADGAYLNFDYTNDDAFNWTVGQLQTNNDWKHLSEIEFYNHFSKPLQIKDINDNYFATKMCDNESKVEVVCNSEYTEMYSSGAEFLSAENTDYFDGEIKSFGRTSFPYHTGRWSVTVGKDQKGFEVNMASGEHRAGQYKISVWVYFNVAANARIHINGTTKEFNGEGNLRAGSWVLLNHYEELSSSQQNIYVTSSSGNVYLDDFRLYPVGSAMVNYVYNGWDELWYVIGSNGLSTKYEYDDAGRISRTYAEVLDFEGSGTGGFKLASQNEYHYNEDLAVVPEIPTGLTFDSATETSLSFSWDEVNDASGYKVYLDGVFESVVSTNSAVISGLAHSNNYDIQVLAYNEVGDGELCSLVSMTTESPVTYTNKGTIYNYSNSTISASTVVITVNNSTTASFELPSLAPGEHYDFSSGYSQPVFSNGIFKVSLYNTTTGVSSSNYFNMNVGSLSTNGSFSFQGWGYGATVFSSGAQYSLGIRIY